jgi:catechol 2,3-dioxygenase-like lactoylglutathione lyase family enzyme
MMKCEAIDHVALGVRDVEHSANWYAKVLGLERQHDDLWHGDPAFVGKDEVSIALFPAKLSDANTQSHQSVAILHFALRVDRDNFLVAQDQLKQLGIEFTFQDHEICHSIYFHDPDGHRVEITTYDITAR